VLAKISRSNLLEMQPELSDSKGLSTQTDEMQKLSKYASTHLSESERKEILEAEGGWDQLKTALDKAATTLNQSEVVIACHSVKGRYSVGFMVKSVGTNKFVSDLEEEMVLVRRPKLTTAVSRLINGDDVDFFGIGIKGILLGDRGGRLALMQRMTQKNASMDSQSYLDLGYTAIVGIHVAENQDAAHEIEKELHHVFGNHSKWNTKFHNTLGKKAKTPGDTLVHIVLKYKEEPDDELFASDDEAV